MAGAANRTATGRSGPAEELDVNVAFPSTRGFALAAALIGALSFATPLPAAAQAVSIVIGGQPMTLNPGPIEQAGRVFVPLRGIFERLGATVVYSSGTINATKGKTTVSLQIGSTQATINGQPQILDVAPFIVGATTYVPLRFIAQSLGATVNYVDSTRVVSISMPHAPPYVPVRPVPPNPPPPPPEIYLVAQQPAPGAAVTNRFATISARFSRAVAPPYVRVTIDGANVTASSAISPSAFSYAPPAPLGYGTHAVRVYGTAADGSRFDRAWSFGVTGEPPPPITLRAQQPAPGASTANRFAVISAQFSRAVAAQSVRVWLDGANRTNQSGISSTGFSFKPPAPLAFGAHTVRVAGNAPGGMPFDRSWSFTVTNPPPSFHLTVTKPGANAVVGTSFVVGGNTIGGARVTVTAGASPAATGQFSGTTTAGPMGNFSIAVNLRTLLGQQAVTVRVTATDPSSGQSTSNVLQLRLNQ